MIDERYPAGFLAAASDITVGDKVEEGREERKGNKKLK